jgi:hypothetical protein
MENGTWKSYKKETILEFGLGDLIAPRPASVYAFGKNKIDSYDFDGDHVYHFSNAKDFAPQDEDWRSTFKKYDAFIVTFEKNLGVLNINFTAV